MGSVWGVSPWELLIGAAFVAADTLWRVRKGKVGGPLSVALSALARAAFFGMFLLVGRPSVPFSRWLLPWLLCLLLYCVLDTWAERNKCTRVNKFTR